MDDLKVEYLALMEARQEAAILKAAIQRLSQTEKLLGAKYLEPVTRLIQKVEAL